MYWNQEKAFVADNEERLAEIEERLKAGEYDEMFAVEELSGGMKTPTSLHEMNAQRQVWTSLKIFFYCIIQDGELGGFTWVKRYLMIFDTYLVLFDREDSVAFRTGKDPETQSPIHKDDVADAIFLFDQETEWCRIQKDRIQIDNRSRTLKLEFKTETAAMEVLLGLFFILFPYKVHNI